MSKVGWVKAPGTAAREDMGGARRDPPAAIRRNHGGSRRERPRQDGDGTSGDLTHPTVLDFELRPAKGDDFPFCWSLYRDSMKPLTVELLEWNELTQRRVVEQSLIDRGTSIIVVSG